MSNGPLDGVRIVEVVAGPSLVGAGMATSLPGALLRDLGATVVRIESGDRPTIDRDVQSARVWSRGKEVRTVADAEVRAAALKAVKGADAVLLCGAEDLIERQGLGARVLRRNDPRLVVVRLRPSYNDCGPMPDDEMLVAARAGLMTQIRGHEPGRPVFPALQVAQAGAAVSATVAVLAGLYERESTGAGCSAETSLYDGLMAMLPMIIGRVENPSPSTALLWQGQGPGESLCYRCADGAYVQLWFGARGAYEQFLESIGDPPSEEGYNAELISGRMVERGRRWSEMFATRDRDDWVEQLAGRNFRCEPVLRPGEALLDEHTRACGLVVDDGDALVLGAPVTVTPTGSGPAPERSGRRLLEGVRVLDMSAFLAGPVAALVLAELGADVVKVEPVSGDVHRNMEPMFAAGQRAKRSVALDLKSSEAAQILDRLFRWADVVHHNSRLGVSDRLGYDEASVRRSNPSVVYSFASGFGEEGPKAPLPANDQLMQALSGIEHAQAGEGQPPSFLVWGAVDVMGGWLAACGIIAGLYAQQVSGQGQSVRSSLYGAGLTLESGAFAAGGRLVNGPTIDRDQFGYGAAYRIYRCGDGRWIAVAAVTDRDWQALVGLFPGEDLPAVPPPLRQEGAEAQPEERLLEKLMESATAAEWLKRLRRGGVPAEAVADADREAFIAGFVDDPVNRQLGRIVTHSWGARGRVDQPTFPPRFPPPAPALRRGIPGLGEHTASVLEQLGFDADRQAELAAAGVIRAG